MSLIPFGSQPPSRSEARLFDRTQTQRGLQLRSQLARNDDVVELAISKLGGVAAVTQAAEIDAAMVWDMGRHLAGTVPEAAGSLQLIAAAGTLAMVGIVTDTARRLR